MQSFFATCPKGMEDLLAQECRDLGIDEVMQSQGGVYFSGDLVQAYRMCLWSRLASRILLQLAEFKADDYDALYAAVQLIDWSEHVDATGSFAIDCYCGHDVMNNSHYATLRIKDALVDQFTAVTGTRPDVHREQPDIRINAYIGKTQSMLYLDLSGDPLHKRGYRRAGGQAPLKENLAAAILLRCKWPEYIKQRKPLFDPMCGSGTLLIEAACMAAGIAPGFYRNYYGFNQWKQHRPDIWQQLYQQAEAQVDYTKIPEITGSDNSQQAVAIAAENIKAAGLQDYIKIECIDIIRDASHRPAESGLLVTNMPYGKRLGEQKQLQQLYSDFGQTLKQHFQGWQAAVFSSNSELVKNTGLRAHHKNTLYNGAIKCTLFQFRIREYSGSQTEQQPDSGWHENATMFANRLQKNLKRISKWAQNNHITCYRVYDADIPQYSVAIDRYQDRIHVQEYQAPKTVNKATAAVRLQDVIEVVAAVMSVDQDHIVVKTRKRQSGSEQYNKLDNSRRRLIVEENRLKFGVNLTDYLDTGLFIDHRITRQLIYNLAGNRDFLNLFAYTGTATVYAAAGGARSTTTVDMSNTYLDQAMDNMKLNGFTDACHRFVREDCLQWIADAGRQGRQYQLVFLDPPTFSNSKKMQTTLDIARDHAALIHQVMPLVSDDGILIFSSNAKKFVLDEQLLKDYFIKDITRQTTPEDFKRNPAHKCWCLMKQAPAQPFDFNLR